MSTVIERVKERANALDIPFSRPPIVIGGIAMEYYGMRKSGADIDLVISDHDYQILAREHPDKRKDIWGDLGVVIDEFEIWRSISLLDYDFFMKDAIAENGFLVVSIDRLLWTRVCAMGTEKYRKDLELMEQYYHDHFRNQSYFSEARLHEKAYLKANGPIFGGEYGE